MMIEAKFLQLWDVCSDQEAVDLVRNVKSPQEASKMLVEHALARFSTDNLSVMVVRFDPKKLQANTTLDIGVQSDATKETGAISEADMIVGEARRHSGLPAEGAAISEDDTEELNRMVIREQDEGNQEPGPELTPEGKLEAEKVMSDRQRSG